MFFKNLKVYQFNQSCSLNQLIDNLGDCAFTECGSSQAFSEGFVAPAPGGAMLHHTAGDYTMICLKRQERIVPSKALREAVNARVAKIEAEEDRKVYRKEKNQITDEVLLDQLPKTLPTSTLTYAYLDATNGLLIVDASSFKQAEALTTRLRKAAGSLPIIPMTYNSLPATVMTNWLEDTMPTGFESYSSCELREIGEEKSVIRCKDIDLYSREILNHIHNGMQVSKLSIQWRDYLSCTLDDEGSIKQLKFTNELLDSVSDEVETAMEQFDADFSLMTGCLAEFLKELKESFGGGMNETHPLAPIDLAA